MSFPIQFTLNRKPYTALVTEELTFGSTMWMVEVDNGSTYLFTRNDRGWQCPELGKDTCRVVGKAIDEQLAMLHH
jgi:hypothetical protein